MQSITFFFLYRAHQKSDDSRVCGIHYNNECMSRLLWKFCSPVSMVSSPKQPFPSDHFGGSVLQHYGNRGRNCERHVCRRPEGACLQICENMCMLPLQKGLNNMTCFVTFKKTFCFYVVQKKLFILIGIAFTSIFSRPHGGAYTIARFSWFDQLIKNYFLSEIWLEHNNRK